jgi:hypothetical protein
MRQAASEKVLYVSLCPFFSRRHEPSRGAAGSPASRVLGRAGGSAASMWLVHVRNVDFQPAKSA